MKRVFPRTDLYGITDFGLSRGRNNVDVVRAMLDCGVKIIQYREKDRKSGVMLEECRAIRQLAREAGACFIVNDYADLALLCDADGVHVGQEDIPLEDLRSLIGPDRIIGLSTHSPAQAEDAVKRGVTYIGVGPLYATKTKKDVCAPVGLEYLDHVVKNHSIPFVAIGGIKEHNLAEVVRHGAKLVCLVSGIVGAPDIPAAIKGLRSAMRQAGGSHA